MLATLTRGNFMTNHLRCVLDHKNHSRFILSTVILDRPEA